MAGDSVQFSDGFREKKESKKQEKRSDISSFMRSSANHFTEYKTMNADENKPSQPTPEQLMRMLDLQLDAIRLKKTELDSHTSLRITSILLILLVAGGALFFLMLFLEDARAERSFNAQKTTEISPE